jgi:hypothetical protein
MRRSILYSDAVFGAWYEDFEARVTVEARGLGRPYRRRMHCSVLLLPSRLQTSPRRILVCDHHLQHYRHYSPPPSIDRVGSQPPNNRG